MTTPDGKMPRGMKIIMCDNVSGSFYPEHFMAPFPDIEPVKILLVSAHLNPLIPLIFLSTDPISY